MTSRASVDGAAPFDEAQKPTHLDQPSAVQPATTVKRRREYKGGIATFVMKFGKAKRLAQSGYYPSAMAAVRNLAPSDRDFLLARLTKVHLVELQSLCDRAIATRKAP